ncbi:Trypanosomal VSG domain [Trypanosoma vivax]|uniref:Trypanosomal VSG domain containing protein n=1 Tax=Trypanosoma vivax (strain Y486) TaxID=1055687 RepID=F9WSG6_TRYVY|nr:Trypanosomal VSG domain [Trypanosoma vivax]CCD20505.1 hypothetical protein, conserved in T. vivax [Trypanosoma vivax Y486]|eukprot:CCD20505.1 hypothetical protein, conserved in T. vivax [Trypanosoma vivax Y486]
MVDNEREKGTDLLAARGDDNGDAARRDASANTQSQCARLAALVDALANSTCAPPKDTPVCNAKTQMEIVTKKITETAKLAAEALEGETDTAQWAAQENQRRPVDDEGHCLASDIVWLCAVGSPTNNNPCVVGCSVSGATAQGSIRSGNVKQEWERYKPHCMHEKEVRVPSGADVWNALDTFRQAIKHTHGTAATGTRAGLGLSTKGGADCARSTHHGCVLYGQKVKTGEVKTYWQKKLIRSITAIEEARVAADKAHKSTQQAHTLAAEARAQSAALHTAATLTAHDKHRHSAERTAQERPQQHTTPQITQQSTNGQQGTRASWERPRTDTRRRKRGNTRTCADSHARGLHCVGVAVRKEHQRATTHTEKRHARREERHSRGEQQSSVARACNVA